MGAPDFRAAEWSTQDAKDRALASVTPLLPAPTFGRLPPLVVGQHRFVVGEDGVYVQARSEVLSVCLRVGRTIPLPYGRVSELVGLPGGQLPAALFKTAVARSVELCPDEWAGLVLWDKTTAAYRLVEPAVEARSTSSVRYNLSGIENSRIVVDLHSHGRGEAYFSQIDDASDAHGVYLACVLGRCKESSGITLATRIVVNGLHFNVPWSPWCDG